MLPIALADTWTPPADANPIPWLLLLLSVSVGLPFFVVSASAPMLQAWFANTGHPSARDPYFLYAASNLGSMIALLGYPVAMEPSLPLAEQTWVWATGYGLLTALTIGCAVMLWRSPREGDGAALGGEPIEPGPAVAVPKWRERLWWLALSFAPSSLLLGVTTHVSTDIASAPLFWVIPLALYLLTFVLVFARRTLLPHAWMLRVQPYLVVLLAALFFHGAGTKAWVFLSLHLATFFVTAMVCHGELARMRPKASRLTEFYLWMSVGGVLGGLFNALVAPNLFPTIIEYPLVLVVACMLRPTVHSAAVHSAARAAWARRLDFALPAAFAVGLGGLVLAIQAAGVTLTVAGVTVILGLAGLAGFSCRTRSVRFGLGVGAIMIVGMFCARRGGHVLHVDRSFFGVVKVQYDPQLNTHVLVHGSTNHGMQSLAPERRDQPLTYFHRTGPVGQVFEARGDPASTREIGIIGLGTGSIATYGQPGQRITYYEIDPAVERIARDPRYFTFLRDRRAEVDVVLGDARLTLSDAPNAHYDLLILDAFSSDAIPIHLITREALKLYLDKLSDRGLLALHISNRYLDLEPVLGNLAADAGLVSRIRKDVQLSPAELRQGKFRSRWVVMARRPENLGSLLDDARWRPVATQPGAALWTDDFSNILAVMKWW